MSESIHVISQQPPGGRCTLYARYAAEISFRLGVAMRVVYSDFRDAHGEGFPSMQVNGVAIQPGDGVILSPEDVHAALVQAGLKLEHCPDLLLKLNLIQERFLEEV